MRRLKSLVWDTRTPTRSAGVPGCRSVRNNHRQTSISILIAVTGSSGQRETPILITLDRLNIQRGASAARRAGRGGVRRFPKAHRRNPVVAELDVGSLHGGPSDAMGSFFPPVLDGMCGPSVIERLTINVLRMDWQMRANARARSVDSCICTHAWKGILQQRSVAAFRLMRAAAPLRRSPRISGHASGFPREVRRFRWFAGGDCWATMAR